MATLEGPTRNSPTEPAGGDVTLVRALSGPLDELLAMAELMERQSLPRAAAEQLQSIMRASLRMARILRDTQDVEDLAEPPALESVDVRGLIDEVEAFWHAREPDGAQLLISMNAPPSLRVLVDPARLRRLLNTLIIDALNASPGGVVDLQLSTVTGSDGLVSILGRLEAPARFKDAGTSMSLALCRGIAMQMDGDLHQVANPGGGTQTSFVIRLGVASALWDNQAGAPVEQEVLPPRTHLLIVDDNATNRIVAAALCEMFGCTSETAEDGFEAVAAVSSRPFDLILMDIKMPGMDGLEATRAIRALDSQAAGTPIVALTANADADAVKSYLACGMQAVVDKPIKPQQLLETLQWVLLSGEADGQPQPIAASA